MPVVPMVLAVSSPAFPSPAFASLVLPLEPAGVQMAELLTTTRLIMRFHNNKHKQK